MNTLADWLGREPEGEAGLTPARRSRSVGEDVRKLADMEIGALEQLTGEKLARKRTVARCTAHLEQVSNLALQRVQPSGPNFYRRPKRG